MQYSENFAFRLPEYGDKAKVDDLNFNATKIDNLIKHDRDMTAPYFDQTVAYVVGDLVQYEGVLYKFIADKAAGNWDETKVEITNLADEVGQGGGSASVTKEATGNPIELTDAASAPLVKCTTEIQGSQDLHGYDKPWVGGAGKNKFEVTANSQTINGVTFTINSDGAVLVNGTATASTYFTLGIVNLPSGNYTLNGSPSGGGHVASDFVLYVYVGSGENFYDRGNGVEFTGGNDTHVSIAIYNGYTANNLLFKPMIRLSTETDPTFAPYSNICPITAYTEGEIEVRGKNKCNQKDATSLSGGILNLTGNGTYGSVTANKTYTFSFDVLESNSNNVQLRLNNVSGSLRNWTSGGLVANTKAKYTFTAAEDGLINFWANSGAFTANIKVFDNIQLEEGSTATTYEPYTSTTHTTTYPSAIYRGSEDVVNGEVTSEMECVKVSDLTVATNLTSGTYASFKRFTLPHASTSVAISQTHGAIGEWGTEANAYFGGNKTNEDYASQVAFAITTDGTLLAIYDPDTTISDADFMVKYGDMHVAYPLATPTTSPVTPTNLPIRTLSGYNHIESSTGEMEVEYVTSEYQPLVDLIQSSQHVYSTQEQVVGKWIDGSDVYERVIHFDPEISISTSFASCGVDSTNMNKVIYVYAIHPDGTGYGDVMADPSLSNHTLLGLKASTQHTAEYIIIRYTKTTATRSLSKSATIENISSETEKSLESSGNVVKTNDTEPEEVNEK